MIAFNTTTAIDISPADADPFASDPADVLAEDVRAILAKHGSTAVLSALRNAVGCLRDHVVENRIGAMSTAERLTQAVDALGWAQDDIAHAESDCRIKVADAAEVLVR